MYTDSYIEKMIILVVSWWYFQINGIYSEYSSYPYKKIKKYHAKNTGEH